MKTIQNKHFAIIVSIAVLLFSYITVNYWGMIVSNNYYPNVAQTVSSSTTLTPEEIQKQLNELDSQINQLNQELTNTTNEVNGLESNQKLTNQPDGANIFHVATFGNDTNDGRSATPIKTIAKAVSLIDAQNIHDAQIILHDGVYYVDAPVQIKAVTDSSKTLKIIAGQGENPIIDGSVSISSQPLSGQSGVYLVNVNYSSGNMPSIWHESRKIRYSPVQSMEVLKTTDYAMYPYATNIIAIHPRGGVLPDSQDLRVSVTDYGLNILRSNVSVKDIYFRGFTKTAYSAPIYIGSNNMKDTIDNISISNVNIENSYSGIYLIKSTLLKKIVIDNCYIHDVSSGINAHGGDVEITKCKIINDASASNLFAFRQADQYMGGAGINVRDNYGLVGSKYTYNVIKGFQHGIALQATANAINGAGYATYEISHNTIVLSNNDITNSGSSFGIQFSRYVGANCDKCGPERAIFTYNIIDGFSIPWNVNKSGASISALATIDKNVLWNSSIDQSTYSKNYAQVSSERGVGTNIVGDPMFVNRSSNDYRVFSNSPAVSISAGALENVNGGTTVADFRIDVPTISGKQKTLSTNTYEVIGSDFTMNIIPYDIASSVNTKISIVPGNPDTTSHKFITTENIVLPTNPGTYTITVVLDNGGGKTSTSHSITVNKKSSDISFGDNFIRANKYGFLVINKNNQNIDQYVSYRKKGSTTWIKGFDDSIYSKAYYDDTKNIGNQPLYVTGLESNTDYEFQIIPKQGTASSVYSVRTVGEPSMIYVSPNGIDDNSRGTNASPLKTLQYALDLALPGDTIKLLSGVYSEPSIIMHSGLSSARIKISGEDSTKVILSGRNTYNTVLSIENASYIDIENVSIQGIIGSGIYCNKCTNVSISNSRFTNKYISASATSALGNAIYIKDASDIDIHHNLIRNWKYGIQAWTSPRIKINNNTLVAMTETAININPNCFDSEITYNTINFSINSTMIISVAPSDRSRFVIDYNNYAGDISTSRGVPDETTNYRKLYLYNNTSYFPTSRELFNYYPSTNSQELITFASFKNWKSTTGWDSHSMFTDPLWEDPLSDDFHLKAGSPNILSQGKYIGAFSSGQNIIVESKTDKIYVSNSGSDSSGDGSSGKPFKTIQKAVDSATVGDTIFVKAGKYDGNITIKNSGTNAKPIRIEGENYGAEINSGIKYSNWQSASEIGPDVYKVAIAKHPSIVTIDDSKIPFVDDVEMSWTKSTDQDYDPNITGLQIMKSDTSLSIPLGYAITGYSNVKFWDVFYGVAGYMNGYLYVRLKDGSNPNTKNILVHDAGSGISVNANNIEINGLSIKGFSTGIRVNGSNIIISGNQIGNSDTRISFASSGSNNTIRDNKIYMNNYGASTGAWANGNTYDAALKEFIYIFYKYMVGTSSSGDTGISMLQPQNDLTIYNNEIYGGLVAMTLGSYSKGYVSSRGSIYNNLIHANSSVGITEMGGIIDYLIYGNTIFDNNSNIRIHMLDSSDYRRVYIYNNKMYQLGSVGNQFFLHWFSGSPKPAKAPENYIYHNSISGGSSSICPDAYADDYGGVPGAYFVNNIFSSNLFMCNTKLSDISNGVGIFDNNWVNGKKSNINPQWFGSKNVISNNSLMWNLSSAPNFASISNSAVFAGLDLSKSNTINGKLLPALPGARSGYFSGTNPNMGYVPGLTGDYTKIGEEIIIVESKTDKIYVSNSGSDSSGDGSSAKPYATVQKALDNAVAGDTVFIKGGNYDARRLTIKNSGSAGKPITIEGEKSSSGERLVTFDGGESMSSWVNAPEIGDGVYKIANKVSPANSSVNSLPYAIVIDGKYADPLRTNNYMDMSVEWKKYMTLDINAEVTADNPEHAQSNQALLGKVKFWDVTKAIFYATKDYTYLRLADKSNPNSHTVRGSFYIPGYWSQDTFVLQDTSYITIKDINFRTYNNAISIRGSGSHDINILNNNIQALKIGVEVQSSAHDIKILNNDIPFAHFGTSFGAWIGSEYTSGSQRYTSDLKQAIYQWYHHWIFNGTAFTGISLSAIPGSNVEISNNKISDGFIGVDVTAQTNTVNNVRVHDNYITGFSSGAIYARGPLINLQIYNNIMKDVNYAVRNHELNLSESRKVYIYNNWVTNPDHIGMGIFFHYFSGTPIPSNPPEIYIYHNNFIGGRNGLNFDAYVGEYGGAKGVFVLNNIISSGDYDLSGANTPEKDFFGAFDYNWLDNMPDVYTKRNWFGSNNIKKANGEGPIMTISTPVNSKVSSASRAYQAGIDLSKTQNINGRTIGPLPGMSGCSSSKPDMGVIVSCGGGTDIIISTSNLTSYDARYTMKKGENLNGSLSINKPISSNIKFFITTQTFRGIVTVKNDGTFTYVPESNFVGTDYFNFKVNDGISDSNVATVRINVENKNDNTNTGGGGGGGSTTGGNTGGNTNNNTTTGNTAINNNTTSNNKETKINTKIVVPVTPVKTPIKNNIVYQNPVRTTTTNTSSVSSSQKINSTLSFGSRGDEVKVLQRVLSKENLLPNTLNTGYYGTLTQSAVQKLQKKYNIVSSGSPRTTGFGVVGNKTLDLVNTLNAKIPSSSSTVSNDDILANPNDQAKNNTTSSSGTVTNNLKFGSRGDEVKTLQQALIKEKLLAPGLTTGYYGTLTESAVQKLQTKYDIISTGNPQTTGYGSVGPKTKEVINTILQR